jgi:hypothetical protein
MQPTNHWTLSEHKATLLLYFIGSDQLISNQLIAAQINLNTFNPQSMKLAVWDASVDRENKQ